MSILSFSNEILYQVFHNLDCLDIISARSTCRRLHLIGKTRLLWESKVLEVSYSSGIPVLESPLENYTPEELEEKLIGRALTRRKWHNLDPPNFCWESFGENPEYEASREYKWLPGGRWLLDRLHGCVYITDLDPSAHKRTECLVDLYDFGVYFLLSNIWIDPTKYWLSEARIAVYCDPDEPPHNGTIWIYRLNSTGQGTNKKWTTQTMTMIERPFPSYETDLYLEKEYVLAIFDRAMGSPPGAYLYKYSDSLHRSHQWDFDRHSKISLLPEGRIGIITPGYIEISVINPVGSHHLELQSILRTPLDPIPGPFRSFNLHSTLRFSYLNIGYEDTLLEIRIPVDANEVYQKRITFTRGPLPEVWGPSVLARAEHDGSMEFISYEFNDSASGQVVSQYSTMQKDVFRGQPTLYNIDVTAGHVLVIQEGRYMLIRI